ncbi:MAG: ATP-binding protein, partial [Erysipelotrichia bacterium]|nr:ATP-binding protein [Erysipelotrichia bacterium]
MSKFHRLPPSASSLSESMRDIGYSLATAIADIIDNSITANASEIEVYCDLTQERPTLAIVDNGHGMNSEELMTAMRHGAANPKQERPPYDLGRFGLGLKTASFSQCRQLTVASSKNGILCGAEWD